MPSDEASKTLAQSSLLQRLQVVDRRERGHDRVLALVVEPARRQHDPGAVLALLPVDLELVHHALVGELLEEAPPQLTRDALGPGVGFGVAEPLARLRVRVQHAVVGDRGDHQRHRHQLDQVLLRLGRARARRHLLLHRALVIELRQHLVETQHQAADLVAAGPNRAQRVVAGAPHRVDDLRQPAQRPRDALRDIGHRGQDHRQQQRRGAQVQPHAGEEIVHAHVDQARQLGRAAGPGGVQRIEHGALGGVDLRALDALAVGGLAHDRAEAVDRRGQRRLRRREVFAQQRIGRGDRLRVVGLDPVAGRAQLALEHEQPRALGRIAYRAAGAVVQPRGDLRDDVEQGRVAQQDQRHRVVAVEVRVEDQVRLVAHARDQVLALLERDVPARVQLARRGREGLGAQQLQRAQELRVQLGAAHALAMPALGVGEPRRDGFADLRGRRAAAERDQRWPQGLDVGGAAELLARKVDRDVLLVDQDAADEDHRAQIEQVDQQQLLADAEVRQRSRERRDHARDHPGRGGREGVTRNHQQAAPKKGRGVRADAAPTWCAAASAQSGTSAHSGDT